MESSPLEFARPLWLLGGPAAALAMAWLFARADRRRAADLAKLVHPRFAARLMPGFSPGRRRLQRGLWLTALLLLAAAAAGPRQGFEWREISRRGIDLLFAVDTSRSMLAEDLSPNRLERARLGIHDFIGRLQGDRVGLIPFAGSSYALCPLTTDYDAFRTSLDALDTDLIPKQGTDVASAIREAERLFDERGNPHRILVLLTDGEDLQGDALEAAAAAAKKGLTIYPVGVGSTTPQPIPLRLANGRSDFVRDQAGNPVQTTLDEATLRKIAEASGGLYVPLGKGAEGLDTIYREKLRLVPKNELESKMEKIPLERFEWPLAAALILLAMEFLLPDRRRPSPPRALPSAARRAAPAALLIGGFLLAAFPTSSSAADPRELYNTGTAQYAAGDFPAAVESLTSALHTPDLKLQNRTYYNLGNAHYRKGQASLSNAPQEALKDWKAASKAYRDALALDPSDGDARFNQKLVQQKVEELEKQTPQDQKDPSPQDPKDDPKDEKSDKEKGEKGDQGKDSSQDQKPGEKGEKGEKGDKEKGEQGEGQDKQPGDPSQEPGKGEEKGDPNQKSQGDPSGKPGDPPGSEGEKKEGTAEGKDGKPDQKPAGEAKPLSEERRATAQMSPQEAKQLLQMMRGAERTVIPIERPRRGRFQDPNNTTKGKTW